jgi:carboxylate-amine ligase
VDGVRRRRNGYLRAVTDHQQGGPPGDRLGVEEEFLVVDPDTRRVVPAAHEVRRAGRTGAAEPDGHAAGWAGIEKELSEYQVEVATRPCADLADLRGRLEDARGMLTAAATRAGYAIMASGTAVLGGSGPLPLADDERYGRMHREYRRILSGQAVCGCHIHLQMPDRATALDTSNRLRVWLPVLQSLAGNSPFFDGSDTGYASWRMLMVDRWPVSGPAPFWHSEEQYDALVSSLVRAGVMLDAGMVYWYLRPSTHVPTLELRVCDVMPEVDDVLLVAGLARALVRVAAAEAGDGVAAVDVPVEMLRAAHWRAARDGLAGAGVDVLTGAAVPAADLARRLVDRVVEVLGRDAETEQLDHLLERLLRRGSPAQRQRARFRERGDLRDVVDGMVAPVAQPTR